MKQNIARSTLTLTLTAICGIVSSGHAFAGETLLKAARNQPTGIISRQELMAHEGGSSGGGGDGLYLNNPNRSDATVVPVPSDLTAYGYLMIKGVPGSDQPETYDYLWCPNLIDASHCKWQKGSLNQPTKIRPGYIGEVVYSGTRLSYSVTFPVKLERDSHLTYELKKLEVPKVDSTFEFSAYLDFSDKKNQRDMSLGPVFYFGYSYPEGKRPDFSNLVYVTPSSLKTIRQGNVQTRDGLRVLVAAMESGEIKAGPEVIAIMKKFADYAQSPSSDGIQSFVGPNGGNLGYIPCTSPLDSYEQARVTDCHLEQYGDSSTGKTHGESIGEQFNFVGDPKDGEFISVFPGTYGIKFTSEDGQVSYVHGIQVK